MIYRQKVRIIGKKLNGLEGIVILLTHPTQYQIQLKSGIRVWVDKSHVLIVE